MSGDRYRITDQYSPYFLTCTIVHWIDLFTRKDYRDIVVQSLNYCIEQKHLIVYAWVIMSNHVHLVVRCEPPGEMSAFLRDFKKFTSKKIADTIMGIPESRREWLLDKFGLKQKEQGVLRTINYGKTITMLLTLLIIDMMEKIDYVHNNPVRAGLVDVPAHYFYSSAIDYAGGKGLVKVVVI